MTTGGATYSERNAEPHDPYYPYPTSRIGHSTVPGRLQVSPPSKTTDGASWDLSAFPGDVLAELSEPNGSASGGARKMTATSLRALIDRCVTDSLP